MALIIPKLLIHKSKKLMPISLIGAFCLVGGIKRVIMDVQNLLSDTFTLQILLCGLLVMINLPVYQGLFLRKDKARMPSSLTQRSIMFALLACALALY
jgi:hypothetical protein